METTPAPNTPTNDSSAPAAANATPNANVTASAQTQSNPVVPPTEQPTFQEAQGSNQYPSGSSTQQTTQEMPQKETSTTFLSSDTVFNTVVALIALVVIGVGGYFIYYNYIGPSTTSLTVAPADVPEAPLDTENNLPAEKKDLSEFNQVTPPEGEPVINTSTPIQETPPPTKRYDNYQYSFSFEYEDKPLYQTLSCSPIGTQENKLVFYDSTNITDNNALYALCEPEATTHFAKVVYTPTATSCLGTSESRSVSGGITATQCSGQTSLASSTDTTISLLIPKDGGTVVIEIKNPKYVDLIQDASDSFSLETQEPEFITEE